MLSNLKANLKFLRRYFYTLLEQSFLRHLLFSKEVMQRDEPTSSRDTKMNPLKNILIYCLKIFIFLILANILIIKPLSNGISKGLEGFDNNPLIKIISLDAISNPLTFIRMSQYYLDKGDAKKAILYLQYAKIIKARYPYPREVNDQIVELEMQIKSLPQ
jgi:hypothetical protein